MTPTFTERMADLAEAWWEDAVAARVEQLGHRALMRMVGTAVALRVARPDAGGRDPRRAESALVLAGRLATLQDADGLFSSDGNLHSPPDSAFTLNDLGTTLELLDRLDDPWYVPVRRQLLTIAERAMSALVLGGVHTPNHRWEIGAALVRLRDLDERAAPRAREWLAEGVDVDADGLYSERSANYAAFVSNPSLLVLAERLVMPELVEVVHRNLHAQLALTDADGVVETVFSRRQDHDMPIPLECFHTQLRRFGLAGCAACAAGAAGSEPSSPEIATIALLEVLADPVLGGALEVSPQPRSDISRRLDGVGLLVEERAGVRTVLYGGSDVPYVGRVGSGIAANPTFVRFRSGAAVIRSLRLSRVFFGLGPFRAEGLRVDADGVAHLHERVAARYYQPLPAERSSPAGVYRFEDEGRFSAAMAFSDRARDAVELVTDVTARVTADAVELAVTMAGAATRWSLEIALGEGELTGVEEIAEDLYRMSSGVAELRRGSDAVVIETDLDPEPDIVGEYLPGEAYSFLGGTDALTGPRLYLTGRSPGSFTLTLRAA